MQTILLLDTEIRTVPHSGGKTETIIEHGTMFSGEVSLVGQQTYWNAKVSNIILEYSVKVRKSLYKNEKFMWINNKLFEVVNLAKSKDQNDILLNIKAKTDSSTSDAVIAWLAARSI